MAFDQQGTRNPQPRRTTSTTSSSSSSTTTTGGSATITYVPPQDPPVTEKTEEERLRIIREKFPHLVHLLVYPEIKKLLFDATDLNWDALQMQNALVQTEWWRSRSISMREWEALQTQDPSEALRQVQQRTTNIFLRASQQGIQLSQSQAEEFARQALRYGWTEQELDFNIGEYARRQPSTGQTGELAGTISSIKAMARDYMIPLADSDAREWAIRIFEGRATSTGVEEWIRDLSKQRFGWMADRIDAGISPDMYYRSLRTQVAGVLEMNPEDIDLMDDRWGDLIEHVDDNGNIRGMTLTEAARWARQQPEWAKTANANQRATEFVTALGEKMGVYS